MTEQPIDTRIDPRHYKRDPRDRLLPEFDLIMEPVMRCGLCGLEGPFKAQIRGKQVTKLKTFTPIYTFSICPRCSFVFQNPVMDAKSMDEYYREVYRPQTTGSLIPTLHQARGEMTRAYCIIRWLERWDVTPTRVLDVGSSAGLLMEALRSRYKAVVQGVEVNPHFSLHTMRFGYPTHTTLEEAPAGFDLITCVHTLEHMRDPLAGLKQMRERMAPGGRLYLEVPNVYDSFTWNFAHNYLFSPYTLRWMMEAAGWKILHMAVHAQANSRFGFNNISVLAEVGVEVPWHGQRERLLHPKIAFGLRWRILMHRLMKRSARFHRFYAWKHPVTGELRRAWGLEETS